MSDGVQGLVEQRESRPAEEVAMAPAAGKVTRRVSESLSDEQQRALGLITQGISIADAGQQLGIHRGTIYRWLKADPYFRAAYNAWQLEQKESCRAALVKAAGEAVDRVIKSIPMNSKLAWQVIKELGILSRPNNPLPVDPSRVEMEIALEGHEEETWLLKRVNQELDLEGDLPAPRGNLGRLLRLRADMELGRSRPPKRTVAEPDPKPAQTEPSEVSRA
jgi:hypothetical protein